MALFGCPAWDPGAINIGLVHFQARGGKRSPNISFVFFVFILCSSIFVFLINGCFFLLGLAFLAG